MMVALSVAAVCTFLGVQIFRGLQANAKRVQGKAVAAGINEALQAKVALEEVELDPDSSWLAIYWASMGEGDVKFADGENYLFNGFTARDNRIVYTGDGSQPPTKSHLDE